MEGRIMRVQLAITACLLWTFAVLGTPQALAADFSASQGYALENGDVNGDMERDVSDALFSLSHLFLGGPAPVPLAYCAGLPPAVENGDTNGDGALDLSDPVRLLGWLFCGGMPPQGACGEGTGAGAARNPNPRVLPPNSSPFGKTYSEWSAEWIKWAMTIPADENPLFDETGALCAVGQPEKVWFLAGRLCVNTADDPFRCKMIETVRTCPVPVGHAICFPVANSWKDTTGSGATMTQEQLLARATMAQDRVIAMACEVDGVSLGGVVPGQNMYRVTTPFFGYTLPENNLYSKFGVYYPSMDVMCMGDGTYVMLAPLSAGDHTIHIATESVGGWAIDMTYELTVE
jgi:hypothetical protein